MVGATGHLGSQVVDELRARGKNVRALVRPATGATRSAARGVQIARGDMLDPASLLAAMDGADAVITTAAGYTGSNKNATEIDTVGNANLATAASQAGVRRFVLTSMGCHQGNLNRKECRDDDKGSQVQRIRWDRRFTDRRGGTPGARGGAGSRTGEGGRHQPQ
ncbi:NAD(P)H-binding protein [Nocardia sp. NPDC004604]|uniref:NAD(P)H-binding protein n=1 Tax=Nocardia sp. NPDC004604 TaxID=3157013 RepID=UPI0033B2C8E6